MKKPRPRTRTRTIGWRLSPTVRQDNELAEKHSGAERNAKT